jgi:hypothetical protein
MGSKWHGMTPASGDASPIQKEDAEVTYRYDGLLLLALD